MFCRVVSWNIHACIGRDGRYDPERIAAVLEDLHADIIGLQEVDWRLQSEHHPSNPLTSIGHSLGMQPIEGPNLSDHRGQYGNGLLTRFNILHVRRIAFEYMGREPRGAIDAVLDHDNQSIRAINTHLGLRARERRTQLKTLRAEIAASEPTDVKLLLGDMNEWLSRRFLQRMLIPDVFSHMAVGRTFPSTFPCFALDCIFTEPFPLQVEVKVIRHREARMASDHLPVVADIEWP